MHNLHATAKQLDIIAQQVFKTRPNKGKVVPLGEPGGQPTAMFVERPIKSRFGYAWYTVSSSLDFNRLMIWDGTDKVDIFLPEEATAEELKTIMSRARDLYQQIKLATNAAAVA